MIASRPFQDAFRNVGRNALDLPVAALSSLAVAFVAFAVPASLLAEAIGASGLPSIIPAAAPPLGLTARAAIGVVGALATFGLVFALLRLLDRSGLDAPRRKRDGDPADEGPRLRRRDFHPDAPVSRPISATRDLGEPQRRGQRTEAPTPLWLAEADPQGEAASGEPVPEAEAYEMEPEPVFESQAEFEPVAEAAPEPEYFAEPEIEAAPQAASAPSSLPELMERLERGLARRQARPAPAPASPAAPQVFPEARDDRLQSAIDSLQRLAARTTAS